MPIVGSLTPKCTSKSWDKVWLTHLYLGGPHSLAPAQLSSPIPCLPPLSSKSMSLKVPKLPPPVHTRFFAYNVSSALNTPLPTSWPELIQLSTYSTLPPGAFPDSLSWTRAPPGTPIVLWASPFILCEKESPPLLCASPQGRDFPKSHLKALSTQHSFLILKTERQDSESNTQPANGFIKPSFPLPCTTSVLPPNNSWLLHSEG